MKKTLFMAALLAAIFLVANSTGRADPLQDGFQSPPDSARPEVWWHWMNGNITKEGITADLEAMQRVGIGGATIINVSEGIPHGPIQFNSQEWRDMVKFAVQEAARLGLEVCVANCGGWSSSGGPWITPEHGMQMVVTSEKAVTGPAHFEGVIPQPPSKLGAYHDIAVLAFPTAGSEVEAESDPAPKVTESTADGKALELKPGQPILLAQPSPNRPQYITLEFPKPVRERVLTLTAGASQPGCRGEIEVSDDGQKYRKIAPMALGVRQDQQTFSFDPVTTRFFRVKFTGVSKPAAHLAIAKVELSPCMKLADFRGKAFYARGAENNTLKNLPEAGPGDVVARGKMVDLSSSMGPDGKLTWEVPEGKWTILRAGYAPNGKLNHPAPPEGTGLDCDKLSKEAAVAHWAGSLDKLIADLGPLAGKTLNGVLIDSYEVGSQNWSPLFRQEFTQRRGYDPARFLPALTGRIVDSPEITERFLWDFRRTIADLFAENYSGTFAELAHRSGLKYSVEPYGDCPTDDMQYGEYADIPMSEFWPSEAGSTNPGNAKLAASIGHVFGRKLIGAESFTAAPAAGKWLKDPYSLKAQGDTVFCAGINRIIYHRYAHQPWLNRFPGMTMGQWGTHFERTLTWWEQSTAWLKYQARCQYLLQSGLFVADACFFCGEGAPNGGIQGKMPAGYDFDGCNTDALLHRMSVKDGRIALPDGMSYRLLVLPQSTTMTPAMLRKLKELADAGATIIGPKPVKSPSLSGYPGCDAEVKQLADELWSKAIVDEPVEQALAALKLAPDFECAQPAVRYIHRTADGADYYFVCNPTAETVNTEALFRVAGKAPEFWDAESGKAAMAPVYTQADGRTSVPLRLEPSGSVFVVFRQAAPADHAVAVHQPETKAASSVASDLTILKAEFGDLGTPATDSADVTDEVQKTFKGGAKSITVGNSLFADPAPNVPKELKVEYTLQGERKSVVVAENKKWELPAGAQITKAVYGAGVDAAPPAPQAKDVTEKLASLVKDGALNVTVGAQALGGDPAPGIVKTLRVEYCLDGAKKTLQLREGAQLSLPPVDGSIVPLPAGELAVQADGRLEVEAWQPGAFGVTTAAGKTLKAEVKNVAAPVEVAGPWVVHFPPNWGAPEKVKLDQLISWTAHPDSGVKYFSGTATYTKEIVVPAKLLGKGKSLYLDLGKVKNLAQVRVNGTDLGILWKPPFRVDITSAVRPGKNALEIKVTNLWPNRLIGDEQLPEDRVWDGKHLKEWPQWLLDGKPSPTGRFTFTTWHHWYKTDEPLESGILGPVTLRPSVHMALQ